jgi:hypothetical protein
VNNVSLAALGVIWGLTMAFYALLSRRNGGIYANSWISRDRRPAAFKLMVLGFTVAGLVLILVCSFILVFRE